MSPIPSTRPPVRAALALAALLLATFTELGAESREFTSTGGTTITAEPVSHDGAGTLTLKLANGSTSEVSVDKLSAADQEWLAEWMKKHPAERAYHFDYKIVEKKLADLERTTGAYSRSKRQRWAYSVVVTNVDRKPVRDLTIRYRVYMRDDVTNAYGAEVGIRSSTGEGFLQKSGELPIAGELRFNDHREFTSESFDLDETRYSYYYSRSRSKDRLAGIIIKVYDATGKAIDTYRSDDKWLASVEWADDEPVATDEPDPRSPMRPLPPGSTPRPPEPEEETAGASPKMAGSRVSIPGAGTVRPITGSSAAAKALMIAPTGEAVPVTFLASSLSGGDDAGAMPVYFTSAISSDLASLMTDIGSTMGTNGEGWPEGRDATLTWSAAFDPADGAAASAACALVLDSLMAGITLDPAVAVAAPLTGDLAVGDQKKLGARLHAAAMDRACSIALVGPGNREAIGDLILTGDIDPLWKVQVIEAADLAGLRAVARSDRDEALQKAMDEFAAVRMLFEASGSAALKSPAVLASLKRVAAAVPAHLSAATLLGYASGQTPAALSLPGSYDILWNSAGPFIGAVRLHLGGKSSDVEATRNALSEMRRMRPKMNPKVLALVDAIADLETTWRDYAGRGAQGQNSPLYPQLREATIKVSKLAEAVEAQL